MDLECDSTKTNNEQIVVHRPFFRQKDLTSLTQQVALHSITTDSG